MTPTATYRLQLHEGFGFRDAAAVVPYLADLGVSHVYCSPVLQAVPGSMHGYDVVDHTRLSADLGGDGGWEDLVSACRDHGLSIVVDVVPNHMAVPTPESLNEPLWDVLRDGRESAYASWFDVDWEAGDGRILMPVLGRPLPACLDAGEISRAPGEVRYYDHRFPVAPGTGDGELAAALDHQHYRLADWREARDRLNYRRFFDVTSLIAVRVEEPDVFGATHERLARLVTAGDVDGLRIDHPDGLADPAGYLEALHGLTGETWVVVEKILEPGESLPRSWRCAGTTGYDALRAVTQVLVDPTGQDPLTSAYTQLTGAEPDVGAVVTASKRLVVDTLFPAEVNRLVRELGDDAPADAADAIRALLVAFDVYRAYPGDADSRDRLDAAEARATAAQPDHATTVRWLGVLLRDEPGSAFATRFAQTTGPVMAKGVEDTAFYRYHRLVALNEVGGDPGEFGGTVEDWHGFCAHLAQQWPATMTTLSTHDTKRSEDVRARLMVLAEIPEQWRRAVERWTAHRLPHPAPDPHVGYLLWQTLVGTWPVEEQRVQDYLLKAVREAKLHTSWTDGDGSYERRLHDHVAAVFAAEDLLADVEEWVSAYVAAPGASNSLAQKLLQLTMPGVPDVYQGQELPGFFLVDPDNRQPVAFDRRRAALAALDRGDAVDAKLRVTAAALRVRRSLPSAFGGDYAPLPVSGAAAAHAVTFARGGRVAIVATRLPVGLAGRGGWGGTAVGLPPGDWTDVLTSRPATPRLGELLGELPVALLVRGDG